MRHIFLLLFLSFLFFSCQDNRRSAEEDVRQEVEREAELQAEEERLEWESNSVAARIVEHQNLSTFMRAIQDADLAETLTEKEGPFTVFAPTNDAFEKVDKDIRDEWLQEENFDDLEEVLSYHIVQDEITLEDLKQRINDREGEYEFVTMDGSELTALLSDDHVVIQDKDGEMATISESEEASNGVLHIIDLVLAGEE